MTRRSRGRDRRAAEERAELRDNNVSDDDESGQGQIVDDIKYRPLGRGEKDEGLLVGDEEGCGRPAHKGTPF